MIIILVRVFAHFLMVVSRISFSGYSQQSSVQIGIQEDHFVERGLFCEVIKTLKGSNTESVERSKPIFFPGDPAEKVYLIKKGVVRLSRLYESGKEITVAFLSENDFFGVSALLTNSLSERFYHAVAFTRVEIESIPATSVRNAIGDDASIGLTLLQLLSSRILQTETMIAILANREMLSKLIGFLLVLSTEFGVPRETGVTINLRLSHQEIAEAIGSTRVTITRLLGELKSSGLLSIHKKKITIIDPLALAKRFN